MDMYLRVRRACLVEGMSIREASRVFGLHRDTVRKMLSHPVPPGYRRKRPPHRPKLESYTGVIDRILEDDLSAPKKQRHTAKRIFDRLKKEHGFDGGYTIVKDYVRERRRVVREMFVPLSHPPGHAQCDFGQAWAFIGGKRRRGPLLRDVAASQRRHIHKGISRGDHGGVLRRSRVGVPLPGRSAAEHTLRQLEACRRQDTGRRTSQAHE